MCASLLRPDRPMRGEAKPKNRVRVDKKPSPAPRRIGLQNRWRRPRAIWSACVSPRLHHRHRLFRRRSNQGWKPRALPTPPRRSPPPSALLAPLPRSRTNLPRKEVTTHLPPLYLYVQPFCILCLPGCLDPRDPGLRFLLCVTEICERLVADVILSCQQW
jgi:hypothetical protein